MWLVTKKQILLFVAMFILFAQTMLVLDFMPILDALFSGLRLFIFFILLFCLYLKHFYLTKLEYVLLLYAIFLGSVSDSCGTYFSAPTGCRHHGCNR